MKKLALSILLALCLCLSLPLAAWADDGASADALHKHCVCGGVSSGVVGHSELPFTLTEWTSTTSLPSEAGNYYLSGDVTISKTWEPATDTVLCLNGHSITMSAEGEAIKVGKNVTFALTDCAATQGKITHSSGKTGGGVYVDGETGSAGTFYLYGGNICGNTTEENGGGVYIAEFATFNMYGGKITGNGASDGGGVYIAEGAAMNMLGGEISGNTAEVYGGGVYKMGDLTLGGSAVINGNTSGDEDYSMRDNIYVDFLENGWKPIAVSKDAPLTGDAQFGLTYPGDENKYLLVKDINGMTGCFFPDDMRYNLEYTDDDRLWIYRIGTYLYVGNVSVVQDDDDVLNDGGSVKYDAVTGTLTLTNATITNESTYPIYEAIEVDDLHTLTIKLVGNNTITANVVKDHESADVYGIEASEATKLVISGSGSLTVKAPDLPVYANTLDVQDGVTLTAIATRESAAQNWSYGIYSYYINIGKATVTATAGPSTGESDGICASSGMYIADGAKVTATGGNVASNDYVNSSGIYVSGYWSDNANKYIAGDLHIGAATVTATSGSVTTSSYWGGYAYGLYAINLTIDEDAKVTATGGTGKATGLDIGSRYGSKVQSNGICATKVNIAAAEVTATAGATTAEAYAYSNGINAVAVSITDGAVVKASGGNVTATNDEGGYTYASSLGFYVYKLEMDAAKVTATGGNVSSLDYAYSTGIDLNYDDEGEDLYYFDMYVNEGAELTITGGNATSTGHRLANSYAYSYGIYGYYSDVVIDGADVTITSGNASAYDKAYSDGVYSGGLAAVNDADVTVKAGNANVSADSTVTINGNYPVYCGSYGVNVRDVGVEGAEMTVTAGNATISTDRVYTYTSTKHYAYNYVHSYAVCADTLWMDEDATLTAKAGIADGRNGKYNYAYSRGIYLWENENYDDEYREFRNTYELNGTLTAIGGKAFANCSKYTYTDGDGNEQSEWLGGYASSLGMAVDGHLTVVDGAKVQMSGGYAECNTTEGGYAFSNGISMYGHFEMEDGSAYISGGNAKGGEDNDGEAMFVGKMYDTYAASTASLFDDDTELHHMMGNMGAMGAMDEPMAPENNEMHEGIDLSEEDGVIVARLSGRDDEGGDGTDGDDGDDSDDDNSDDDNYGDGELNVCGGWLKLVSNDIAVYAEGGVGWSGVELIIPEGGIVTGLTNDEEELYFTIIEASEDDSEDIKIATIALFYDGEADELSPVAVDTSSGSGGGGHKKNDTTKEDEKKDENKDETKTDENTENNTVAPGEATTDNIDQVFNDTDSDDWYAGAATYAYNNGLMKGNDDGSFGANESATRGQVVTILHRLMDEPEAGDSTFTDIFGHEYYADAVAWAAENGIVLGYEDGTFKANIKVTREELVTILYRFAKEQGIDVTQGGMAVREYSDWEQISEWAMPAMQWAVNTGLVKGDENGCLNPGAACTRAEIATILMRFNENIMKGVNA